MAYETSYDAGLKPFNHDKDRGKWASPKDFIFACLGHAFKIDAVFAIPSMIFRGMGIYALIPYFILTLVCTVPIVFIQTFLGQFSSTGFISAFRIAPLFKGIGYVSLAINMTTLTYYSIFAALPLFYFFHSMRPTLPWSCEGSAEWMWSHEFRVKNWPCNLTKVEYTEYDMIENPSLKFFTQHINIISSFRYERPVVTFIWQLVVCSFLIWFIVWIVLRNSTQRIGQIIRYSTLVMLVLLVVCVLRFAFLPGAFSGLVVFFKPQRVYRNGYLFLPFVALSCLGPGWGSILTMASFNSFRNNITKQTWILCLGQFGLMILGSFSWIFIESFIVSSHSNKLFLTEESKSWMHFMTVPTALSLLEMPNFWSIIYFGMLTLGATSLLVVQLLSVLTSLFDEFEQLRANKEKFIRITIAILALGSTLYCSNYGVGTFILMARFSVATQIFLNLMLLLVVLWIYGRERLQRDVQFMTSRFYSTWMVYVVRFGTPIVLLFAFLIGMLIAVLESNFTIVLFGIVTFLTFVPWLLIPGYCVFKITQTTGILRRRFRQSVQPTDWYPVDPDDRQRYAETFGNSDTSHQLVISNEECA